MTDATSIRFFRLWHNRAIRDLVRSAYLNGSIEPCVVEDYRMLRHIEAIEAEWETERRRRSP